MKIIVALDGSDASDAVLQVVKRRPWPAGSEIRVLSVTEAVYFPPPAMAGMAAATYPYPGTQMTSESLATTNAHLLDHATKLAQRGAEELRSTGCSVEGIGDSGDARDRIVGHATDWQADLIVIGSHGRTGLKRWLLGSVAESVVRHAPCSVEVARIRTA